MSLSFLRRAGAAAPVAAARLSATPARALSRITLIGNLAGPPETQESPQGKMFIRYGVAVNSGPRENRHTSWFRVTAASQEGPMRDFMLSVPKGSLVCVEGNAIVEQWTTPDGQQRSGLKIWQTNFEVLKRPARDEQQGEDGGEESYGR
jgi:single-stranded DNA-binding protein